MGPLARAVPCDQVGCCERGTGLPPRVRISSVKCYGLCQVVAGTNCFGRHPLGLRLGRGGVAAPACGRWASVLREAVGVVKDESVTVGQTGMDIARGVLSM